MKDTTLTPPLPAQLRLCIAFCGVAIALSISNAVAQQTLNPVKLPVSAELATPKAGSVADIPVVIIRFLPTADNVNLDDAKAPQGGTLEFRNAQLDSETAQIKFAVTEGSRFRGYKTASAPASLGYRIVDSFAFYEDQAPPASSVVNISVQGQNTPGIDYFPILQAINAQHYVNDLGVKEFWVYFTPNPPDTADWRALQESNMASPTTGDVSNSYRFSNDLPIYPRSYVVFEYDFQHWNDPSAFIHEHGHQREAMLSYVADYQDGNDNLFWNDFVGHNSDGSMGLGRCGWTHVPPNTIVEYDYDNPTLVSSDIEDWRPDHLGRQKQVNRDTWGNKVYAWPAGPVTIDMKWYVYWWQSFPGFGNIIPHPNGGVMTNWWTFLAKWDEATTARAGLHTDPAFFLSGLSDATATQNVSFSRQITGANNPTSYGAVGLPAGVTINSSTGVISGFVAIAGSYTVLVTVTNSSGTGTGILKLTVDGARSETEKLTVQAKTPAVTHDVFTDAKMSGGAGSILNATAAGQFVSYGLPVAAAGTYKVKVGLKTQNNKGAFQLAINGTKQGSKQDEYSANLAYVARDLGIVTFFNAGTQTFTFTVTGKNANSSSYGIDFDYIELISIPHSETETLHIQNKSTNVSHVVFTDPKLSGGAGSILNATAPGQFVTYAVPVSAPGTYNVRVRMKTQNDKGIFQLAISGVNQGAPQDEYSAIAGYVIKDFGKVTFPAGGNKSFKFSVTGRNLNSIGFPIDFDYIELVP